MTPPRRSSPLITKRPRKRRRKEGTTTKATRRSLRNLTRPLGTPKSNKPSLLTLPDEPLTQIIGLLSTQSPSLLPPPAFYLAQTNTRFLNIFTSLLTSIKPYTSNPAPTTLSSTHLAAVSRIAGDHLRAIHVPEGALWAELADDCPGLEELSFRDDWHSGKILRHVLKGLRLKVLEVYRPSHETLFLLNMRLEKLVLKDVSISNIDPLLAILRNPPREIVLEMEYLGHRRMERVMTALETAILKMEKASISVCPLFAPDEIEEDVRKVLKQLRESGHERKCSVVSLCGLDTFRLLRFVDRCAKVRLGCEGIEYRNDAPGEECYLTKWAVFEHCPSVDVTRLEEVTLYLYPRPAWMKRLPSLRHVRVFHNNVLPPVTTEILTVPIPTTCYEEWNLPTRELRFAKRHMDKTDVLSFCETIAKVLDKFRGETLWMEFVRGYDLPKDLDAVRRHVRCAKYSCEYFQQEGGDAGSVLAWLDDVFSRCF